MNVIDDSSIDFDYWSKIPEDAANVKPASNWCQDVIDDLYGDTYDPGATLPWSKTHSNVKIRPGELSLWGGINGHKKSMLLGQVMIHIMAQGEPVCIASMEMKPRKTMGRMTKQALGLIEPSEQFIKRFHHWTNKKLWLYDQTGTVKPGRMFALARYCFEHLKIKHMVIDSLMKCGIKKDDFEGQTRFIDQLCSLAKDNNAHVHMVLHARKGADEYTKPGKFDIRGAGEIVDQADNLFMVWDNKRKYAEMKKQDPKPEIADQPDLLVMVEKQRNGDWEGSIALWMLDCLQHVAGPNKPPIDPCGIVHDGFELTG